MSSHLQTTSQTQYFYNMCNSHESKNLNNEGCASIASGEFLNAIRILKNALEINQLGLSNENTARAPCACKFCRTESFLPMHINESEDARCDDAEEKKCPSHINRNKPSSSIEIGCGEMDVDDENDIQATVSRTGPLDREDNEAFIYRRPLLVSQHSIDQFHYMGKTLSFTILFNIALAHHLNAIEMLPFMSRRSEQLAALEQPLKLYELAYRLNFQSNEELNDTSANQSLDDNNTIVNLRLMILITNNISQIHREARNETKHHQCLSQLLNSLMYLSHNIASQHFQNSVLTALEKDGIFDNLASILKSKIYAAAA